MIKTMLVALLLPATTAAALAQVAPAGQPVPAGQPPAAPGQPTPVQPVPGAKPAAPGPAPSATAARTFTAPVGLLFNTVRADKTLDFERLVSQVRKTLESSTDPALQAMAKGWQFYKATEPGPANSVIYVFVIDPVVPGEDYGLGRVLSSGSTDTAALQEIWKLYTGSVTGGGSLLNLSPIPEPPPPAAPGETPVVETEKPAAPPDPAAPAPATPPPTRQP